VLLHRVEIIYRLVTLCSQSGDKIETETLYRVGIVYKVETTYRVETLQSQWRYYTVRVNTLYIQSETIYSPSRYTVQ